MIHPTAIVETKKIGSNTKVWQNCLILDGAEIGDHCVINYNVYIESDVVVGDYVTVKSGVQLWNGVHLANHVFVGPNVSFTNDNIPRAQQYKKEKQQTKVELGASIGANVTLVGGITIGKYAMIGAGSVVTKSIPPYSLWYGNPARFKGFVCKCGNKLDEVYHCDDCGKDYHMEDGIMAQTHKQPLK